MDDPKKNNDPPAPGEAIARMVAAAGEQGEPDQYAGKRQKTRYAEAMRLEITLDRSRPSAATSVYMHNVSEGGFAFWCRQKMTPRSMLHVRELSEDNSNPWLPARITHCTVGIRGFLVGAAFDTPPPAR